MTCKDCTHWFKAEATPATLGQQPHGECRGMPPQVIVLPALGPLGQKGVQLSAHYPLLGEAHEPCGLFVPRLTLLTKEPVA
jgi:hypothetical protein